MLDIYPREQLAKAMTIWVTGITIGPIMGRHSVVGSR